MNDFDNTVDPDQLVSCEAIGSGSIMSSSLLVKLCLKVNTIILGRTVVHKTIQHDNGKQKMKNGTLVLRDSIYKCCFVDNADTLFLIYPVMLSRKCVMLR